jgi:hypothetical protein
MIYEDTYALKGTSTLTERARTVHQQILSSFVFYSSAEGVIESINSF